MGWPLDDVLDLDIDTFNGIFVAFIRIDYQEKIENAWTMMVSTQCQPKELKRWTAAWRNVIEGAGGEKPKTRGLNDFLKDFGADFSGNRQR